MTLGTWEQRGMQARALDIVRSTAARFDPIGAAAGLLVVAGVAHAVAVPAHRGWPAAAAFFALLAASQFGFAVALMGKAIPIAIRAARYVTVAIMALYAASRTVGVPFGPHPWTPEAIGVLDLTAAAAECALVLCLAWLGAGPANSRSGFGRARALTAWLTLATLAAGIAAAVPVAAHSHASAPMAGHAPDLPMPAHRPAHRPDPGVHEPQSHHGSRGTSCASEAAPASLTPGADPSRATAFAYSEHGDLVVYDVATDTATTVLEAGDECWFGEAVLRDHRTLLFSQDQAAYELDLPSGRISTLTGVRRLASSAWSPDRSVLAFTSWDDRWSRLSLSLYDAKTGLIRLIRIFEEEVMGGCGWQGDESRVEWSRDGSKLLVTQTAFDDEDGTVFMMDVAGVDLTAPRYGTYARWLADSRSVIYESLDHESDRRWRVLDTVTSKERPLPVDGWRFRPQLSPDGTRLAYDDGGHPDQTDASVMIMDLTTMKERVLADGFAGPIWLDDHTLAATRTGACGEHGCHDGNWEHTDIVERIDVESAVTGATLAATNTMWTAVLYGRTPPSETRGMPLFDPRDDLTTSTLSEISFDVHAVDPDSGALRYRARGLPDGATFDPSSRRFTWEPQIGQDGRWLVRFSAADADGHLARQTIAITVRSLVETVLDAVPAG